MPSPIRPKKAKPAKKAARAPKKRAAKSPSPLEELVEAEHMFEADRDQPAFAKRLRRIEREKPAKKAR